MTNDTYRKLLYFFENKIEVHFKDVDNIFYNCLILDLNEKKQTMIIDERVKGTMPILLELVNNNSIRKMEEKE